MAGSRDAAPLTFIDCDNCDMSHIRQEITFVNYVRDPGLAEVHVMITRQGTGGGGRMYSLAFTGRGPFDGVRNTLTFAARATATSAEEREGLTRVLSLGLVPYVARTTLVVQLSLTFDDAGEARPVAAADRWKNWTFEVYGGGNFNVEARQDSWSARYGSYASRVTDDWKVQFRPYFNHNGRTIRRPEEEDVRISQRRHGFDSHLIRSLGPHWGAGLFGSYETTTIDNLDHRVTVAPAIEYSLYPYAQASRRQITLTYRVGYEAADYIEETIYEKTQETLFNQSLNASVRIRQPWGSIFSGLTGSMYLHDASYHRIRANSNLSFRLGRGIALDVGGSYERINDQLALPRGDTSLEDILLQRRRLATSYRGSGSIGLSYTFGSIYSNIVNPRF
ncbi:MAG: hypothetical protein KFH98_13175 [Gemmatimonadetes bacterium]|nr:hypothetical protein [Gemmatimonadota bacterium]